MSALDSSAGLVPCPACTGSGYLSSDRRHPRLAADPVALGQAIQLLSGDPESVLQTIDEAITHNPALLSGPPGATLGPVTDRERRLVQDARTELLGELIEAAEDREPNVAEWLGNRPVR